MSPNFVWIMYGIASVACLWGVVVGWVAWWKMRTYTWLGIGLVTTWAFVLVAALVIQRSPFSPEQSALNLVLRDAQRWFLWSLPWICLWLIAHRITVDNGRLTELGKIASWPLHPFSAIAELILKKVRKATADNNPPNEKYLN